MKVSGKTDTGMIRQMNQDYFLIKNEKIGIFANLFLLADGVGSNRLSGFASKHCCDFIIDEANDNNNTQNVIDAMSILYKLVNLDLYNRILRNKEYTGSGTTLVMASIENNVLSVGNIGDSRLYLIRNDILQVTKDHSLAEEMVDQKQIERYSEQYYGMKNQLTKAIGATRKINPDFFEVELLEGDYILMCSDGLSNMVSDKDIKNIILSDGDLDSKVDKLIDTANKNGGLDNIAIILIYIDNEDIVIEKPIFDNSLINDKFYKPHIEVMDEDGTKIYRKDIEFKNLKVNVQEILDRNKIEIDENLRGVSRKKINDDSYDDKKIENKKNVENIIRKEDHENE